MGNSKTYRIVFFSGTGGTRRAAELFERALLSRDLQVVITELVSRVDVDAYLTTDFAAADSETLVLFFPVYSFNEPTPVAEWVECLPAVLSTQAQKQAALISISGGGDIPSNSACRSRVIKKLETKGY